MPIRASSSKQVDALIADLVSGDFVQREAAMARLTVLGARAVERLLAVASGGAPVPARVSAFRTLEAIADPRTVDTALRAIESPEPAIASAAISVARGFMRGPRGAAIVDAITTLAIDETRPDDLRISALRALNELEPATVAPLLERLAVDPSARVRAEAGRKPAAGRRRTVIDPAAALARAADHLPDDPRSLQALVNAASETAPLPLLLSIVERIRDRERTLPAAQHMGWMTARAAAHHALAKRGSRLALYDLRESLAAARAPLPVEFMSALSAIGDASCLEPIAAAYAAGGRTASRDDWWRQHLAAAFRTIAAREKITRRHAVSKKIETRWREAARTLWKG